MAILATLDITLIPTTVTDGEKITFSALRGSLSPIVVTATIRETSIVDPDNDFLKGATHPSSSTENLYQLYIDKKTHPDLSYEKVQDNKIRVSAQNENIKDWQIIDDPVWASFEPEPLVLFNLKSLEYLTADENRCVDVRVKTIVTAGSAPYEIRSFYNGAIQETKIVNDEADLFLDFPRSTLGTRSIRLLSEGRQIVTSVPIVSRHAALNIGNIEYGAFDATVTLSPVTIPNEISNSPYQFSIDDITYQSSNVFVLTESGDYTGYSIDKFGCKRSRTFSVDIEQPKPDPFFQVEITNPLRYVKQGSVDFKRIDNTLTADYNIPDVDSRFYKQPFRIGDVIRTQFKSNYDNSEANVVNECNGEVVMTITPELKVKNTNLVDKRDCLLKAGAEGKTNIIFESGVIYDPETGDEIQSYFQPGGRLPDFARAGMRVELSDSLLTGTFIVEEIVFDNDAGAWACQINAIFPASGFIGAIARSTYNREEYDIYEFEFNQDKGQYHVLITADDDAIEYPDILYKSEPFFFDDDLDVVVIDYSGTENQALIDYSTNIQFRLCVPGKMVIYEPEAVDDEELRDDLGNIHLQKSTYNRAWSLHTDLIPWWIAEKLVIASKHRSLFLNGLRVTKIEDPEVTNRIEERNPFYELTGNYQQQVEIDISQQTGIISGRRGVLGANENQVIGI